MLLLALLFINSASSNSTKQKEHRKDEVQEKSYLMCKGCQIFINIIKDCISEEVVSDAYGYIMAKCENSKYFSKICSFIDYDLVDKMVNDVALGVESKKYCELLKIC